MRNGLYQIDFKTARGSGAGVVVLEDGVIRGGDSTMFYTGKYTLAAGGAFAAQVQTGAHAPGQSVFGRFDLDIALAGSFNGDQASLTGQAAQAPGIVLVANLKRLAN